MVLNSPGRTCSVTCFFNKNGFSREIEMSGTPLSGRPSVESQIKTLGAQEPPKMPADLKGRFAKQLWKQAVEDLGHVLRPVDFAVLKLCCQSFEMSQTSEDEKVRLSAMRMFASLSHKIGLDPSSRRVVKPAPSEVEPSEPDPFQQWLDRGGLNGRDTPMRE